MDAMITIFSLNITAWDKPRIACCCWQQNPCLDWIGVEDDNLFFISHGMRMRSHGSLLFPERSPLAPVHPQTSPHVSSGSAG